MSDDDSPILSRSDLASPTWAKLKRYIECKQQQVRLSIESDLDATATAKLRGKLMVYRNLLALENPDPAMVADEDRE